MDRGDTGFVIHESFKDLKARRAEQEAYRKALEEQIMQKRKLQEQEKYEVRRTEQGKYSSPSQATKKTTQPSLIHISHIEPPEGYKSVGSNFQPRGVDKDTSDLAQNAPLCGQHRPTSKGRFLSFNNDIDDFNEPHPAAVVAADKQENLAPGTTATTPTDIPCFSPECMKYLQQVMPGFTLPVLPSTPTSASKGKDDITQDEIINHTPRKDASDNPPKSASQDHHNQAFSYGSSGTTSESSSVEDVQTPAKIKIHVSQTSEQLEGVKVSRKQYREELQRQIDEKNRRDKELRRKAEEEEARIQEKIRIEQEKMQREYEEELRKQEEREREAEKKRLATLATQKDVVSARAKEQSKITKCEDSKEQVFSKTDTLKENYYTSSGSIPNPYNSEDSIQSIGDFFDETLPQGKKYIDPDDRMIPVVAKRLKEKSMQQEVFGVVDGGNNENASLTARVDSTFPASSRTIPDNEGPPPPQAGIAREIAIRSAPCPQTSSFVDLGFLSTLKSYLQNEKAKLDERILARTSKSSERF